MTPKRLYPSGSVHPIFGDILESIRPLSADGVSGYLKLPLRTEAEVRKERESKGSEMDRDEHESLQDELRCAKAYANEIRGVAKIMEKFAPTHGDARDLYEETASFLMDLASDFEHAKPFAAMRRRLEEDEQADADREAGQQRRALVAAQTGR